MNTQGRVLSSTGPQTSIASPSSLVHPRCFSLTVATETVNQSDGCKLTTAGTCRVQADRQASIDWIRLLSRCDWRGRRVGSPVIEVKQVGIIRDASPRWAAPQGTHSASTTTSERGTVSVSVVLVENRNSRLSIYICIFSKKKFNV